ncbi:MAG TPA: PD-(D/E)XK nuclease family protein [Chloroflexota bacterium]|jgi:CRISPR/Cas system-associated exonuclease Cas4 (RecB family)
MVQEEDTRISATRLANCPRKIALKRRVNYTVDPDSSWKMLRGSIFHKGLEYLEDSEAVREIELERLFFFRPDANGVAKEVVTIYGRLDLAYPDRGVIVDWKSTERRPRSPKDSHIAQLSIYAWLARSRDWEFTKGEIVYFTMGAVRRFTVDLWSEADTELYIRDRLPDLLQAYDDAAPLAPVMGSNHPDYFMCARCEVRRECVAAEAEGK